MQYPTGNFSAPSGKPGLVSCLCVTEDRPAFLPWLLWNYRKQDYRARELVIVDSSGGPPTVPDDPAVTVVRCPPRTSVARKRNLAVEAASGTLITWFDDDDWQHPRKLSILAAALCDDEVLAGPRRSWFIDLQRDRARPHETQRSVLFNGLACAVPRSTACASTSNGARGRHGLVDLGAPRRRAAPNASCRRSSRAGSATPRTSAIRPPAMSFPHPLADVGRAVGAADWGETGEELARLRSRLGD